jgi:surfactin synthase thioesterase subunit
MAPESEASDWKKQTSAGFRFEMFPGGHFFPVQARTLILDLIAADLKLPSPQISGGHAAFLRIRSNGSNI